MPSLSAVTVAVGEKLLSVIVTPLTVLVIVVNPLSVPLKLNVNGAALMGNCVATTAVHAMPVISGNFAKGHEVALVCSLLSAY